MMGVERLNSSRDQMSRSAQRTMLFAEVRRQFSLSKMRHTGKGVDAELASGANLASLARLVGNNVAKLIRAVRTM